MRILPGITLTALAALASCQSNVETGSQQAATETTPDCGFYEANLVDKNGVAIGTAEVTDDGANLHIVLAGNEGYRFWIVRAYAGTDPVPTNSDGATSSSWFPYQFNLGDGTTNAASYPTDYEIVIPMSDLGIEAGTCGQINVAIYARMKQFNADGGLHNTVRSWADGPTSIADVNDHNHDAKAFTYDFCCDDEEAGCTLTQGYWKTHNATANPKPLHIAWPGPAETDLLCGEELLTILETPPYGDGWYILAHQFIAATLNGSNGASAPAEVQQALAEADSLLTSTCGGMSADERAQAIALSETLDDYNNGLSGPGHCGDVGASEE